MRLGALAIVLAGSCAVLAVGAGRADAAPSFRVGWSLGASQSLQSVLTDSPQAFVGVAGSTTSVQRFTGLVFNTGVTANGTIDILAREWDHGLVFGVALNQLVPTLAPADANPATTAATTAFQANAAYLARLTRPRWSLSLGANYAFGLNGQMAIAENGGLSPPAGTLPGEQVGPLLVNGQTHNASARAIVQLNRLRWDADLSLDYLFAANGVFTLGVAPPAPGGGGAAGAGTAFGTFVPATTHTITPALRTRRRLGQQGSLSANLSASLLEPVEVSTVEGLVQNLVPETLTFNATLGYEHIYRDETRWFVTGGVVFALRSPTEVIAAPAADQMGAAQMAVQINGRALIDPATGAAYGLRPDTLTYTAEVGLAGRFRKLDLRYRLAAGVAQPRLFQPPLGGATNNFPIYDQPVVGDIQPIVSLTLDRRFNPVDVSLAAQRTVAIGGLGASSVLTDSGAVSGRYNVALGRDAVQLSLNAGLNVARTRSVGAEYFPNNPDVGAAGAALVALANGNDSVGATVGFALPLNTGVDGLRLDLDGAYALTYNDPTAGQPEGTPVPAGLTPFTSHTLLFTIRGTWGRGPLESAGDQDKTQQNAFAQNPRTGSPLVTARLLNLRGQSIGEPRGLAPGMPAPAEGSSASPLVAPPPPKDAETGVGRAEGVSRVEDASGAQLDADAPPRKSDEPPKKKEKRTAPLWDDPPPAGTPGAAPPPATAPAPDPSGAPSPAPSPAPAGPAADKKKKKDEKRPDDKAKDEDVEHF